MHSGVTGTPALEDEDEDELLSPAVLSPVSLDPREVGVPVLELPVLGREVEPDVLLPPVVSAVSGPGGAVGVPEVAGAVVLVSSVSLPDSAGSDAQPEVVRNNSATRVGILMGRG